MAPPKDIARSYPKRGLTADVGFRSEPKFCGDGSTEFDGSADYLLADSSLNGAADLSYSVWVNLDSNSSTRTIVGENSEVTIYLYGNKIGVWNLWGTLGAGEYAEKQATNNAPTGQWIHIGVSFTYSSNTLKLYIDGVDQPTVPSPVVGPGSTSGKLEIGARDNSGSPLAFLDGKVANVKRFNVALTQAQIRELYNNPGLDVPTGVSSSNLKRHYKLDTNFNDSGADSENLTAFGSPSLTVTRPQLPRGLDLARGAAMARVYTGRAVDFDGSTDFLDMGFGVDKNYTTRSDRASFSFWFNTDQTSATSFIYQNRTQLGGTSRSECETQVFTHPSLGLAFDGDFASILIPITAFKIGQWHHFVGIADDTDGPIKAYLDGVLYDTTSIPQAGANGSTFCIGARSITPLQPFNGRLSNFKIFNVELTQAQVRELYHNPEMVIPTGVSASNLRRHYPLCAYNDTGGMGGRYESDQGVEGVNGEYGGSPVMAFAQPVPCPQLGLQQSASRIYFDGSGGGSTGPRWDASLSTAPGATWAVAYWLWMDSSVSSYSFIFEASGFQHYILTGGDLKWSNGLQTTFTSAFPSSKQDKWSHVVMTSTGSSPYVKCYVDGVEQTTTTGASDAKGFDATAFTVLARPSLTAGFHKGFCANMAIFDDALSSAEVIELFNQGIGYDLRNDTGDYASSADLLNYWLFDDLTSVVDRKGSDNLTNPTSTAFSKMASFPENASGSTIVGDFSMKRKGVSVLNCHNVDGLQQVRAEIPSGAGVQPSLTNGHTVSVWYRNQMQDTTSANNGTFIFSGDGTTSNRYFLESLNGNTFRGCYGNIQVTGTGTISDNDWHHYAMCLDMSTSPFPTVRLYLDGVADNTGTQALGTTFPEDTTFVGYMGANRAPFNYELKGPIACVRIYNTQLSENEIKQIYHADERLMKGLNNE